MPGNFCPALSSAPLDLERGFRGVKGGECEAETQKHSKLRPFCRCQPEFGAASLALVTGATGKQQDAQTCTAHKIRVPGPESHRRC